MNEQDQKNPEEHEGESDPRPGDEPPNRDQGEVERAEREGERNYVWEWGNKPSIEPPDKWV